MNKPAIKDILTTLVSTLPSPHSKMAYIRDVRQYQDWCKKNFVDELFELDRSKAEKYKNFLVDKFAPTTVARKLSAIRGLYKEANLRDKSILNPYYEIDFVTPRVKKPKVRPLDSSEVERTLLFPKLTTEEGHRDYVLLYVMFSLGLKIGEVTGIHVKDFRKYQDGVLLQVRKPAARGFYTKVPDSTQFVINRYLKKFRITNFLFTSQAKNREKEYGKRSPLTPRSGWVAVKHYLKLAKLDHGRTTSCARDFFIDNLLRQDIPAETLRRVLGLGSLNAMKRYGITDLEKAKSLLVFNDHPVDKIKIMIREF